MSSKGSEFAKKHMCRPDLPAILITIKTVEEVVRVIIAKINYNFKY